MARTTMTRDLGIDSSATAEMEMAHRVHNEVMRVIGRTINPSGDPDCLAVAIRKLAAGLAEEARNRGVVLSEDDYAELAEAVMKVELASHIRIWISDVVGSLGESSVSTGVVAMRHRAESHV